MADEIFFSSRPTLDESETAPERRFGTLTPSVLLALPSLILGIAFAVVISIFLPMVMGFLDYHIYKMFGVIIGYQSWYIWLLLVVWVLCIIPPLWKMLVLQTTNFEFTSQRIYYSRGVFSRQRDQLEIARIRDLATFKPFMLRIVGLGNLTLDTADRSHPVLTIPGQRGVDMLKEWLHHLNIHERKRLGYREFENTN